MKNGWQTKRLGEVCEIIKGRKPELKAAASNGDLPYLVAKVMRGSAEAEYASVKDRNSVTVEESETIIICDGSNSGEVFTGFRGILSSTMGKISKKAEIDDDYLRAFLASTFEVFNGAKTGAAIPHLDKEAMYQLEFPFPSLPEQQRIVGILDEAFAGLATAKANAEKNLQNARALFESHLQSVFTLRGKGWVEKRLEEIGKTQTGSTPKTSDQTNYGDFISFVKPADFNPDGSLDYEKDGLSKTGLANARVVPAGSVLMVCIGATIGKCGYCDQDVTTNQQINALTPTDGSSHRFLYYQMLTDSFQRSVIHRSGQATLPIINKSKWSALSVWLPPTVAEQKQIAAKFDLLVSETQRLASIYEQKLAALEGLKKSLLHQAFTGEL